MKIHELAISFAGLLALTAGCGNGVDAPGGGGGENGTGGGATGGGGTDAGGSATGGTGGSLSGPAAVGEACDTTTVCPEGGSGSATCRESWPGGYCLVEGCSEHAHDCPEDPGKGTSGYGAKCVLDPSATCLAMCGSEADCRDGYVCEPRPDSAGHGSVLVCVPG